MVMTRVVRLIGYWDGPAETLDEWPDVCAFVAAVDADQQAGVAEYLRSGTMLAAAAGISVCRICGVANGSGELTDGVNFVWTEGLAPGVSVSDAQGAARARASGAAGGQG
jgi:hypothetical protein